MRCPTPTILSKLARLVPALVLILGIVVAPVWGGVHHQSLSVGTCCSNPSGEAQSNEQDQSNDDCCGPTCHGCICPTAKLILISGLSLAPRTVAIAPAIAAIELSALSLSEADPIFHPPRA